VTITGIQWRHWEVPLREGQVQSCISKRCGPYWLGLSCFAQGCLGQVVMSCHVCLFVRSAGSCQIRTCHAVGSAAWCDLSVEDNLVLGVKANCSCKPSGSPPRGIPSGCSPAPMLIAAIAQSLSGNSCAVIVRPQLLGSVLFAVQAAQGGCRGAVTGAVTGAC
jgi:hypothetical protein